MENSINDGGMLKVNLTLTSSPSSPRVEICVPKSGISSSKLRDEISNATKIPLSSLKLIFRGRLIANKSDGDVVTEYKLEDGCVLHCMGKPDTTNVSSSTATATATATAGASVSMGTSNTTANTATATATATSTSSLEDALKMLKTNCGSGDKYMTAITTLEKIVSNITGHPMEEKYRKVKRDNAAFQRRLGSISGSRQLLLAVGFQEQDFNGVPHYVLLPSPQAWPALLKAHEQIKAAVTQAKAATQTFTPPTNNLTHNNNFTNMPSMPPIMPGMESAMQNLMSNPQQLQAMLQNPMVRNMMESDPRFANNPMLRQSLDALANNPQMMEQMSQMMADPGMRSQINNMMRQQQSMPPIFPPNSAPTTANNANASTNNTNNNNNNTNTGNNDGDQTEEEMIAEAIARSLREQ